MFSLKHHGAARADLSAELREAQDWQVGAFLAIEHFLDIAAVAVDPLSASLAIGTAEGGLHILGGPGVEKHWALSEPVRIKFLQFAASLSKLVSIDETNHLHVWDLSPRGQPKLQANSRFNAPVTWLTISPSHTHAFVALASGEVKTYDLLCLRVSQYTIPNILSLYEKETLREAEHLISIAEPAVPIEVVIHPRNLDLVFVAYSGGVVLSDLEQRSTIGAYRLILPLGAPGGSGHNGPDLLKLRRPSVTSVAIHPSGHFLAAGHVDGCISFWAVEDQDNPLTVRTLDAVDVHLPDMNGFDNEGAVSPASEREPIFKLAWSGFPNSSDPRGGATALFVLGGQTTQDTPGMYVLWFPAFNPAEPPASPGSRTLHPVFRKGMQDSLVPLEAFFYPTSGLTQDFYLVPRDSPHFSGSWDPAAILLLSESEGKSCAVEAYSVSLPPTVSATLPSSPKPKSPGPPSLPNDLADELASTLESMKVDDGTPRRLTLPHALWTGPAAVTSTTLHVLDRDPYEKLVRGADLDEDALPLRGGSAWIDGDSAGNDLKFAKYQPHRILISQHRDCTVQFQDISAQLRLRTESVPLQRDIPNPLPRLTIDPLFMLADPSLSTVFPPGSLNQLKISAVAFATESLECYIILRTGEILVYRFDSDSGSTKGLSGKLVDEELISLEHIAAPLRQRFHPYLVLAAKKGPVVACAPSDIGFFAASFNGGLLMIVDMRGPKIIYRSDKDSSAKRKSAFLRNSQDLDTYTSLTWTVCRTDSDPVPRVRLLSVLASGRTKIFSLNRSSNGSWIVDILPSTPEAPAQPVFSAVLDAYTGARFKADRYGLSRALDPSSEDVIAGKGHSYWIVAGAKGVRCTVDVDGERVGKDDWPHKAGKVECCEIVERNGSQALVAFTDRHEALVYSLPALEHLHTLQLPAQSNLPISPDPSGDFLQHTPFPAAASLIARTTYSTLFDIRRAYYHVTPEVDLLAGKKPVPPQPQPVSMGPPSIKDVVGGWLGSWGAGVGVTGVMTGDQIDALLAGPNRPIPKPVSPPPASSLKPASTSDRASIRTSARQTRGTSPSPSRASEVSEEVSGTGGLYERLTAGMSERGQVLGDLEEQFRSLEEGSRSMVAQAKRLAGEQTGKNWFGF
ncbi:hypothetical protein NEOLEDRAFT_1083589 [Neolentinus lepideus HHB14362 ss-1]|uniref:Lethal giant larvae (Lgl)-like C-terminal domain-containing protein n=1 Tax=Neolentinus lepideus HHB14362 ss-1 TaxID=1314782 RepID=A0A165WC90_9AGAM|nr:hypothetical protein NEOLEDRAFT_1083589 [Neolentinus lepideus HHB14362 ss-1]